MTLDEDGGDDVVAGADVVEELVQEIAVVGPFPQVVMRVDDGQVGLEDRFRRLLGEPGLVRARRCGRIESGVQKAGSPRVPSSPQALACRISAAQRSSSGSTSSAFAGGTLKMSRATLASR
jgi:hypothetical protein